MLVGCYNAMRILNFEFDGWIQVADVSVEFGWLSSENNALNVGWKRVNGLHELWSKTDFNEVVREVFCCYWLVEIIAKC